MGVRKIKKSYLSVTGTFYSLKNERSVEYESLLERDFFLSLEFDKSVETYEEQPFTIYYDRNGIKTRYTPDCLVHYEDKSLKSCVYEVKYSSELKSKKIFLKEKFEQIEEYLYKNDMDFKLFTEIDISPIKLENMRFLYGYSNLIHNNVIYEAIGVLRTVSSKQAKFQDILDLYSKSRYKQLEIIPYIWNQVLRGGIEIDLDKPISKDTIIKINLLSHEEMEKFYP